MIGLLLSLTLFSAAHAQSLLGDIVDDVAGRVDQHVDGKMLEGKNKLKAKASCALQAKKHKNAKEWLKCCQENEGNGDGCDDQLVAAAEEKKAEAEAKAQEEAAAKEAEKSQ